MQCVILAGGLGSRMRPATDHIPKVMLPVLDRPFVEHQIDLLRANDITDVVYCIAHLGDMVRDHLGNGKRFGVRVRYVDEGTNRLGTGGALRLALDQGALANRFFVLYGDSYLPTDFHAIEKAFMETPEPALMTVFRNANQWVPSNVVFNNDRVTLYDKRPKYAITPMQWIDYGISVFEPRIIEEFVPPGAVVDLSDVFHELSTRGRLAGHEVAERFYEIGSPEGLEALERLLKR